MPWQQLAERTGVVLRFLPITADGRLDLEKLDRELTSRCRLVTLTHCSNVTGALTDVAPIVEAAREVGAKVMLDGAQRAPHGLLDVQTLDIDFYAFSGHKTYGPTGIGVLWGRRELLASMPPFMTGGQMIEEVMLTHTNFRPPPRCFEAGTPPIAAAIGLGAALDWMQTLDWAAIQLHELQLTRRLLDGLMVIPGARILGSTITFETFPFPDGLTPNIPTQQFESSPHMAAIVNAARRLDELRIRWLNPPDLTRIEPEVVPGFPERVVPRDAAAAATLRARTLTNLYNERPQWLVEAHEALDAAVAAAYGWPADIGRSWPTSSPNTRCRPRWKFVPACPRRRWGNCRKRSCLLRRLPSGKLAMRYPQMRPKSPEG